MADGAEGVTAAAARALDALLRPPARKGAAAVLVTTAVARSGDFVSAAAKAVSERELIARLRRAKVTVVAVARVSAALARAIRSSPVDLVVVTDQSDGALVSLPCPVLGPGARLRVAGGTDFAFADSPGELEGLSRALGRDALRLSVCPVPSWLWSWLDIVPGRRGLIAGYAPARVLDLHWARWAQRSASAHVVVPLGLGHVDIDADEPETIAPAVVAHALERWTGPVFPSPRVIGLVLAGMGRPARRSKSAATADAAANAFWDQARRALPAAGAAVGMEAPLPSLVLESPTAAFMAQRPLLRAQARRQLAGSDHTLPDPEALHLDRGGEVLTTAPAILSDHESKVVLKDVGIEITRQAVAASASGASGFADRIGYPVVLKAISPDLRRREEIGAVVLDLDTAAAVRRAYATIVRNVEHRAPTARLDGVLVAEMVDAGVDLRCGAIRIGRDAVAVYGCPPPGGPATEPTVGLAPREATDALLLADAVLARVPVPGLRRSTDPDVHALADLLIRLTAVMDAGGDRLLRVDLNPVRLLQGSRRYVVLDARIEQAPHLEGT